MSGDTLVRLVDIDKTFKVRSRGFRRAVLHAVRDVSLDVAAGEVVGLVGESGCGKSTTGRIVAGLLEPDAGEIIWESGQPQAAGIRRGGASQVQMVFQDPYGSLDPRMTVAQIIGQPLRVQHISRTIITQRVHEVMDLVGLSRTYKVRFPHEFSGGQRQRIAIARALALQPRLLVLDEAVSALDVSVKAQIVNLLLDLRDELDLAYLFISHDLGIVEHIADRVVVMYLGRIVESAPKLQLFTQPRHPYTQLLLGAIPISDPELRSTRSKVRMSGDLPSPLNPPAGCVFSSRCPRVQDLCRRVSPEDTVDATTATTFACHFPLDAGQKVS